MHFYGCSENQKGRREWQSPESILKDIGLKLGSTFVDVGCGEGFFSIPAARLVGQEGKVCCLDVNSDAIEVLRKNATMAGVENLTLKVGRAEETIFCEACADFVFFGIVLHDFRNIGKVLENSRTMLKSSGRLVNLDWRKEPMPFGPPLQIRLTEKEAAKKIEKAGFKIESTRSVGVYSYLIVAVPMT